MSMKTLGITGLAAATLLGSTILATEQAEARPGFRGGGYRGGGGFYRGGGYGYRGGYGRRGYGYGAAGLGLGLAAGALAAGTYGYGGGYGGGYPAYGYGGGYGGCYLQPRRVWGPYGWSYVNVRVCY